MAHGAAMKLKYAFSKYISKHVLVYTKCPSFILRLSSLVTGIAKKRQLNHLVLDEWQISGCCVINIIIKFSVLSQF